MYKWSSYVFKTPIIHPSFVHDYLRSKKSTSQQVQQEVEDVFEAIILQERNLPTFFVNIWDLDHIIQ